MNTPPRGVTTVESEADSILVRSHWLRAATGKAWRPILILWIYSGVFAACGIGLGRLLNALTGSVLPGPVVNVASFGGAVTVAAVSADHVLGRLKRRIHW